MTERLVARTVKLDESPNMLDLIPEGGGLAWLTPGTSLVAKGECLRVDPGTGESRFSGEAERIEALLAGADLEDEVDLPGSGPIAFGSWTFDPDSPGSSLVVPSTIYGTGDGVAWKTSVRYVGGRQARTGTKSGPSPHPGEDQPLADEWASSVESALRRIREGKLQKVVLAREVVVQGTAQFSARKVMTRLVDAYPGCFTFWFDDLVGASPELLIRRLGDVVDSIPLAGSAPRGAGDDEDAELGRRLQASAKNRAEHELTVKTVLDALRPFCEELVAEKEPSLLLLANMQHLSTKVQGRLKGSQPSALKLVAATHPTAAVCGVPEEQAMQFIRANEGFRRGRYAGPVGWIDHKGDGEWAVALRCAQLNGRRARVFAGAGIVEGSDPESELEETELKLQVMLSALRS